MFIPVPLPLDRCRDPLPLPCCHIDDRLRSKLVIPLPVVIKDVDGDGCAKPFTEMVPASRRSIGRMLMVFALWNFIFGAAVFGF